MMGLGRQCALEKEKAQARGRESGLRKSYALFLLNEKGGLEGEEGKNGGGARGRRERKGKDRANGVN